MATKACKVPSTTITSYSGRMSSASSSATSSSSSECDVTMPDPSSSGATAESSRQVMCRSARMKRRRHAVDHGRETPIPIEDLEAILLRNQESPDQSMSTPAKRSTTTATPTSKLRTQSTKIKATVATSR